MEKLRDMFYPYDILLEAIPVHFAEGYMYNGEYDYNQKTIIIDPLDMLLRGNSIECYVDRNVLFMLHVIPGYFEGDTISGDVAPLLAGVYIKTEVTGATVDPEGYFDPSIHSSSASLDFSTAGDEVTISLVVIDPDSDDSGPN